MSKLERITFTLPTDLASRMRASVEAGEYFVVSEIAREALEDWAERQDARAAKLERLKSMIAEAEASEMLDGETVMAEMREYVRKLVAEGQDGVTPGIDRAA